MLTSTESQSARGLGRPARPTSHLSFRREPEPDVAPPTLSPPPPPRESATIPTLAPPPRESATMPTLAPPPRESATTPTLAPSSFRAALAAQRELLFRRALFLTGRSSAADDLVQEALVKALASHATFHAGSNLGAWLTAIMRNVWLDARRKERNLRPLDESKLEPAVPGARPAPWLEHLSFADIEAAVATYPPREREVFHLAYVEKASTRVMAVRLGVREPTVGTRLFRLRAKLRAHLEALVATRLAGA